MTHRSYLLDQNWPKREKVQKFLTKQIFSEAQPDFEEQVESKVEFSVDWGRSTLCFKELKMETVPTQLQKTMWVIQAPWGCHPQCNIKSICSRSCLLTAVYRSYLSCLTSSFSLGSHLQFFRIKQDLISYSPANEVDEHFTYTQACSCPVHLNVSLVLALYPPK